MDTRPWYRQFWPWFIIALPATVVVAGLTTWWIAASGADSLVVDEYYKDGLAINQRLDKQQRAASLGYSATLYNRGSAIEVALAGPVSPAAISLLLSHPLDAELDQRLQMPRIRDRVYRVEWQLPDVPRWHFQIEPLGVSEGESWRLHGEWTSPGVDAAQR